MTSAVGICGICEAPFLRPYKPGRPAKYCSAECRIAARGVYWKAYSAKNAAVPTVIACRVCGRESVGRAGRVYCSAECHKGRIRPPHSGKRTPDQEREHNHRRRAAMFGVGADRVVSSMVFERDRWRCQLCGEKVRKPVRRRDPDGPSIDHVVPLSRGGEHTWTNVRLAHLRCNVKRGNRVAA